MKTAFPTIDFGLYRDDGLGSYNKLTGRNAERLKKEIIGLFQAMNLKITIEMGMDQVNFLDVSLRLSDGKFWPYSKPNDELLYVNNQSNHPPTIKKHLPKSIGKRISTISCDENEFRKVEEKYNDALAASGYSEKIQYCKEPAKPRVRTRTITWFNLDLDLDVNLQGPYGAIRR